MRLAKKRAWDELGLLSYFCRSVDQLFFAKFDPDIAYFAVLENVENKSNMTVTSVTGLP